MSILNPYTTEPDPNELNIMLFGTPLVVYDSFLVNSLGSYQISYPHKLHIVTTLPLEEDIHRPRIEYCIFIVSMDSSISFEFVKQAFSQLSYTYKKERSVFVVLNSKDESKYTYSIEDLQLFLKDYQIPLLYCNSNDLINIQSVTKSIYTLSERAWKQKSITNNNIFLYSNL